MTSEATHVDGHGHAGDAHHDHDHHVCDAKTFVALLGVLMFLTFITVWVAQFDFGGANMWIAMAIASVKASLVMSVFMHMIWDTTINKLFFLSSFLFLGLLFLFAFADLFARGDMVTKHNENAPLNYMDMREQYAPDSIELQFHKQWPTKDQ